MLNLIVARGHTAANTPDLFRTPKLTAAGPGQYWGGGPPGKSFGCRGLLLGAKLFSKPALKRPGHTSFTVGILAQGTISGCCISQAFFCPMLFSSKLIGGAKVVSKPALKRLTNTSFAVTILAQGTICGCCIPKAFFWPMSITPKLISGAEDAFLAPTGPNFAKCPKEGPNSPR